MHLDEFRDHCIAKPAVGEGLPFGPDALVFKVGDPDAKGGNKMFALLSLERTPPTATLKCDPERAVELRERFADVAPGYHMNKTHWNTVGLRGDAPADLIREMIDHSYGLVVAGLPRSVRDRVTERRGE